MMDIHAMPGHLIRRLNQISVALFAEHMNRSGLSLTPVQFAALSAVASHPGIDQASVAGLVAYDRATLGKVIDKLEERGFMRRATSPKDRRAKALELTEAGHELLKAARPVVLALQPDILTGLSEEERQTFLNLIEKITMAGNTLSRAPLRPLDP
ncbi:MAG: MarR family transcriptional regulator [Aestuariivita sp.]|uniref:MarR family winged helix-turn-helix transcriptional regulator n=1 Tax=Aestuariivita sp. TaxID=1872407 RepID=UPI003BAF0805